MVFKKTLTYGFAKFYMVTIQHTIYDLIHIFRFTTCDGTISIQFSLHSSWFIQGPRDHD